MLGQIEQLQVLYFDRSLIPYNKTCPITPVIAITIKTIINTPNAIQLSPSFEFLTCF